MLRTIPRNSFSPRFQCSLVPSLARHWLGTPRRREELRRRGLARLTLWVLLLVLPGLQIAQAQQCWAWTDVGGFGITGGNETAGIWQSASEALDSLSCSACIYYDGGYTGPSGWVCNPDTPLTTLTTWHVLTRTAGAAQGRFPIRSLARLIG
jgi:hypothetical protein